MPSIESFDLSEKKRRGGGPCWTMLQMLWHQKIDSLAWSPLLTRLRTHQINIRAVVASVKKIVGWALTDFGRTNMELEMPPY